MAKGQMWENGCMKIVTCLSWNLAFKIIPIFLYLDNEPFIGGKYATTPTTRLDNSLNKE